MSAEAKKNVWLQLHDVESMLQHAAEEISVMKEAVLEAESASQAEFLRRYAAQCIADLAAVLRDELPMDSSSGSSTCSLPSAESEELMAVTPSQRHQQH